jgi:hypothetical protein
MKLLATLVLSAALAFPAHAAIVHDEGVNGDISTNPNAPTPIVFAVGANRVIGSVRNGGTPADPRDYLTFTIPPGAMLTPLTLVAFAPTNIAFASFNSGSTSWIPAFDTDPFFLAGIHVNTSAIGLDLMEQFVCCAVTSNALPGPFLGPGTYTFLIQQTNNITTSYTLDFVLQAAVPADASTWGGIKSLYR